MGTLRPQPGLIICDPAAGTGGFLLAAHDDIANHKDEIIALQIISSIPRRSAPSPALTFEKLKELADALSQPPRPDRPGLPRAPRRTITSATAHVR